RTDLEQHTVHNVFYVPEAVGNPAIPDQQGFVIPHGVRSVAGFGGTPPRRQIFAVFLFARCHPARPSPALFGPLSLSVKLALMDFHAPELAASAAGAVAATRGDDPELLATRIRTLEELVRVYEGTVADQARQMERTQAELHRQALVDPLTGLANRRAFDDRL